LTPSMSTRIDVARETSAELSAARAAARTVAVRAIRTIEGIFVSALGEERLRGLPNLGTRDAPFYAERVSSNRANASKLPLDGREVLAIGTDGALVVVRSRRGRVESRAVLDDELVLEDLEPFTRLVADLLERFAELSGRRTERLERVSSLARRLLAVAEEFRIDTDRL